MSSVEAVARVPARSAHPGVLRRQIGSELALVFGRRRNQAMLAFLTIIPIFVGVAVKISAPPHGEGPPFTSQLTSNGVFLTFTALTPQRPRPRPRAGNRPYLSRALPTSQRRFRHCRRRRPLGEASIA